MALKAAATSAKPGSMPRADQNRLQHSLDVMASIGRQLDGSVKRLAFSAEDQQARTLLSEWLIAAGASVYVDAAGNLIGRVAGIDSDLPALVTGSHLDTVPTGGRFDGALGVLAGLEVIRCLKDNGWKLRHPLEVVAFADEESTMVGCKGMTGTASNQTVDYSCTNGGQIDRNLEAIGGDWDSLTTARRPSDSISAFIELHVEQGGILEQRGHSIGVVQGVVGQRRFVVRVDGTANHAGTTPMGGRQDALVAAAQAILCIQNLAASHKGDPVATVGKLQVWPNAANVIPGQVQMTVDLRDLSINVLEDLVHQLTSKLEEISGFNGCDISLEPQFSVDPTPADSIVAGAIAAVSTDLELSSSHLPSRASHDSQEIGRRWPMGMIFVPSRGGLSHSAAEFTSSRQCADGASVLLNSLVKLDQSLDQNHI
ncbi:MAG: Zn-dependent hydrolase [Synechococcus sp. TMED155]|jgi:N-carbamoyl-L-amino-acid hydrolase|nr:MAG: Zn-dependent hydrolase [Synechococcus sp. TMED155]